MSFALSQKKRYSNFPGMQKLLEFDPIKGIDILKLGQKKQKLGDSCLHSSIRKP